MQKLLALLLSVLLIFSLCSCKTVETDTPLPDDSLPTDNPLRQEQPTQDTTKEKENVNKSEDSSNSSETEEPQKNEQSSMLDPNPQTPSSPTVSEPQIPDINEIVTNHIPLPKEQYYQYSYLNDKEKALYNEFRVAVEKRQNILDITKYRFNEETVKKIYSAFTADCPQYFYISKYCTYQITSLYQSTDEIVFKFILQYTDGNVIDTFDENNNPTVIADRQKINDQIIEFNNKISAILSYIPSNASELDKEKIIYEYITDTVTYDDDVGTALEINPDFLSHSFSAYGAACKGMAVCEGYVKLFQYLCYNSGINVTPIESGENMQHIWAAVKIDNNWYMADITWDDTDDELICTYTYFNITTLQISADHSFGAALKIPLCNSDKASFYNNFALIPTNNNTPENYREIIKNSDKYLYIYRGKNSLDLKDFINDKIYYGEIGKYIQSLGFTLSDKYYLNDMYYYIPIQISK